MAREISPGALEAVLADLQYPAIRSDVAAELRDVTVVLDGDAVNVGAAVSETHADVFDAPEDLLAALRAALPDLEAE